MFIIMFPIKDFYVTNAINGTSLPLVQRTGQ